jgi:hypothetical protein
MKNIVRRIERLEKRILPDPKAAARIRELMEQLEAGERRVEAYYKLHGLTRHSLEGLPPKKVHTSHGIQLYMDILNEGRDRGAAPQREGLRQPGPLATGDATAGRPDIPTSPVLDPPMGDSPMGD